MNADPPPPPLPLALLPAALFAVVTVLAPRADRVSGGATLSFPVFNEGPLMERVSEGLGVVGYLLIALVALAGLAARPAARWLALAALVLTVLTDLTTSSIGLLGTLADGPAGGWALTLTASSLWGMGTTLAVTTLLALAGVRTVRPLGTVGTVAGVLAVLGALVPSSLVFDLLATATIPELDGRLEDPWRIAAWVVRPLVAVAAVPLLLRMEPLRAWGWAWPLLLVGSVVVTITLRELGRDEPVLWIVPVSSVALIGYLCPAIFGRVFAGGTPEPEPAEEAAA